MLVGEARAVQEEHHTPGLGQDEQAHGGDGCY